MDDETVTPLQLLLVMAVTELILDRPARGRRALLERLADRTDRALPVPLRDGDEVRLREATRALFEQLLPNWLSR